MTRRYRFKERPAKPLDPVVAQYAREEVQRLSDHFVATVESNPTLLVEAYTALPLPNLQDLLLQELKETPMSPISQEMRRVVLLFARERAELAAKEISTGD